jgi:hypothetical protein
VWKKKRREKNGLFLSKRTTFLQFAVKDDSKEQGNNENTTFEVVSKTYAR